MSNPFHNEIYHQKAVAPSFYESDVLGHDNKKVHMIHLDFGDGRVIDEVATPQNKAEYKDIYEAFLKSLAKPAKKDKEK